MQKLQEDELKQAFKNYDFDKKNELIRFLCMYRKGEYLYPSVLKRNMKTTNEVVEKILNLMVENSIAIKCFRYICPNCGSEFGSFLNDGDEIEYPCCDRCDTEIENPSLKSYAYKIV